MDRVRNFGIRETEFKRRDGIWQLDKRLAMDSTAKEGLTQFWELFTMIFARSKISNVNNIVS